MFFELLIFIDSLNNINAIISNSTNCYNNGSKIESFQANGLQNDLQQVGYQK